MKYLLTNILKKFLIKVYFSIRKRINIMIIIKKSGDVYFPRNTDKEVDSLRLISELDMGKVTIPVTAEKVPSYYKINVDISDLDSGEYNYSLLSNNVEIETGVLRITKNAIAFKAYTEITAEYCPDEGISKSYYPNDDRYVLKDDYDTFKEDTYTKSEIDGKLNNIDLSDYYTKSEIDDKFNGITDRLSKV